MSRAPAAAAARCRRCPPAAAAARRRRPPPPARRRRSPLCYPPTFALQLLLFSAKLSPLHARAATSLCWRTSGQLLLQMLADSVQQQLHALSARAHVWTQSYSGSLKSYQHYLTVCYRQSGNLVRFEKSAHLPPGGAPRRQLAGGGRFNGAPKASAGAPEDSQEGPRAGFGPLPGASRAGDPGGAPLGPAWIRFPRSLRNSLPRHFNVDLRSLSPRTRGASSRPTLKCRGVGARR